VDSGINNTISPELISGTRRKKGISENAGQSRQGVADGDRNEGIELGYISAIERLASRFFGKEAVH
jgi:hypothetical protein